jgi:predicted AAA+ superfamily ATPase
VDKDTLKRIITDFHSAPIPNVFDRELSLPLNLEKVITLSGIRRSGKTSLLFITIHRLINSGVAKPCIIYLNFEDDRLFPVRLSEMDLILRAYHELYPDKIDETKYLFFDEIHQVNQWEKYIRRIYDTENIRIYLTGSSSGMVSREISAALRGRGVHYEVFPLGFKEILNFKRIKVDSYSSKTDAMVQHALQDYLVWGGFPEIIKNEEPQLRNKILTEYADLILYKDLIEQYGIQNQFLLKYLLKHFMVNAATLVSANKLYNDLRSQGISLSKNSLYEYLEYMIDAYILFRTPKYSSSVRVQQQNPSKYYVIDTGLIRVFLADPMANRGRKLENAVYLHLRTRTDIKEIFYYKDRKEVDFLYQKGPNTHLIKVAHGIHSSDTAARELSGLEEARKMFPQADCSLVLNDWDPRLIPENVAVVTARVFLTR